MTMTACMICCEDFTTTCPGVACGDCRATFACSRCLRAWSAASGRQETCPVCRRSSGRTPAGRPIAVTPMVLCEVLALVCYACLRVALLLMEMQASESWPRRSLASAVLLTASTLTHLF